MGCCWSSDEDKGYQDPTINERTRLLDNPVSDTSSRPITNNYSSHSTPPQQKGDEQSALNRILHQTASNVIDVAAIDTHSMEQHEYMDRARQYRERVAIVCNQSNRIRGVPILPTGTTAPQLILASQPVSLPDIQLVSTAAEQVSKAVKEIKVRHKEDLVVPFGVP